MRFIAGINLFATRYPATQTWNIASNGVTNYIYTQVLVVCSNSCRCSGKPTLICLYTDVARFVIREFYLIFQLVWGRQCNRCKLKQYVTTRVMFVSCWSNKTTEEGRCSVLPHHPTTLPHRPLHYRTVYYTTTTPHYTTTLTLHHHTVTLHPLPPSNNIGGKHMGPIMFAYSRPCVFLETGMMWVWCRLMQQLGYLRVIRAEIITKKYGYIS